MHVIQLAVQLPPVLVDLVEITLVVLRGSHGRAEQQAGYDLQNIITFDKKLIPGTRLDITCERNYVITFKDNIIPTSWSILFFFLVLFDRQLGYSCNHKSKWEREVRKKENIPKIRGGKIHKREGKAHIASSSISNWDVEVGK